VLPVLPVLAFPIRAENHNAEEPLMTVTIRPLHPVFAGEVSGVTISRPLSGAEVAAIEAGMDRHAVLVFRDQPLTDEQQIAFGGYFGELEGSIAGAMTRPGEHRIAPQLADVSNLDKNNEPRARHDRRRLYSLGNRLWHSDASFRAIGAKYSMLSARVVPGKGGNTEFADMRAAYDALDDATRAEVEDLITEHSIAYSRAELGFTDFDDHRDLTTPVRHRLVRTHPVTGRKSLYLSAHIGGIIGWPVPEARAFLRDLTEFATQRRFVHAHEWRVGDLVIWDNRQTMHRARRYDDLNEARDMRRTTIRGDGPTAPQASAA
jgi:alpha-ketoglutarate-dependent 2,4-dichlorophenoxyacetate dioxygenase